VGECLPTRASESPVAPEVFMRGLVVAVLASAVCGLTLLAATSQGPSPSSALDVRVVRFFEQHRYDWRDMNVPEADGQLLHDLVMKSGYTRALEIGTSTGRSGIWIAWALSKTGGRLTTIDIDRGRHEQAVHNFQEAGVAAFIDARLADAHDLVPALAGPYDFVFIDADKEWYTNYAKAVIPKLAVGGCLAAHNVYLRDGRRGGGMTGDYYSYVSGLPFMETTVTPGGVAISYKRRER
jgi:caffeoyl-CoA O-methyltransferase